MTQPFLFKSSFVEVLYEAMRGAIFPKRDLFEKELIAVPSFGQRLWLERKIAKEEGIFFGTKIVTLEDLMRRLYQPKLPTQYDLCLAIIKELEGIEQEEVKRYLGESARRKVELADHLATLFVRYGLYGTAPHFKSSWQKELWQRLPFDSWHEAIQKGMKSIPNQIHLFGFTYIPELFLEALPHSCFIWQLCPTSGFYSDLTFEKGASGVREFLALTAPLSKRFERAVEERDWDQEALYPPLEESSTLKMVQRRLIELDDEPLNSCDRSVEIVVAKSARAEVEELFERLMKEEIDPGEIMIAAPQIDDYLPYIRALFEKPSSPFSVTIYDLKKGEGNPYFELLMEIVELKGERFEREKVLHLLTHEIFVRSIGFTTDEVVRLQRILKSLPIYWGLNVKMRGEIIPDFEESTARGTWQGAFEQLIEQFIYGSDDLFEKELIPYSEMALLGRWIDACQRLERSLRPFRDGACRTLEEWRESWIALAESFVLPLQRGDEEHEILMRSFDALLTPFISLHELKIPLDLVKRRIEAVMREKSGGLGENLLDALTFATLSSVRAVPKRWIYLLGMSETFPQPKQLDPLDFSLKPPTTQDEGRQLFLEALLSAREKVTFSYPSNELTLPNEGGGSLLLQQIVQLTGCQTSIVQPKRYQESPDSLPFWVPSKTHELVKQLDIAELFRFAKDPHQLYLSKSLKLDLREREILEEGSCEPFSLNALDRYSLRKALRTTEPEVLLQSQSLQKQLPLGYYGDLARDEVRELKREVDSAMKQFGITSAPSFIEFRSGLKSQEGPFFPSLWINVEGEEVELVGRLEGVTPQGLICEERGDLVDHVKNWPKLLLLPYIPHIKPALLYPRTKKSFEESIEKVRLADYLQLYLMGVEKPSLVQPTWVAALLKYDPKMALEKIKMQKETRFSRPSLALKHLYPSLEELDESILASWSPLIRRIYEPLK